MSLKIISVVNASKPEGEFVRLYASAKMNAKGYALVDRTFDSDGTISNEFRHIYVFPNIELKAKDWIRLYTGNGKYKTVENTDGSNIHLLYWNSNECVWNDKGGDTATLIKYTVENKVIVPAVSK
ncbi:hypothetical protein [Flavobacterium terrisoli]|uniref:hypothetical protein n=1 Tax=Flavobacterium terrisoli TaxID=3242195 RepID=UPI002543437E|nr:hypothetical protein [Flavobacterium buctense]